MKIIFSIVTLSALLGVANAVSASADIYYHEQSQTLGKSMWTVGPEGVSIYSPDGATVIKKMSPADLGCPSTGCYYFAVASDGHSHVWATTLHAFPPRVDVFSIETGEYMGGVGVCSTPLDLDYVPAREEMWVRCAEPNNKEVDMESGHINVISTGSLSASNEEVRLSDNRQYGRSAFHSSLGNYGYATANDANVLYKVDMAQRSVASNITLPGAHSSYDLTYSSANKHLYIRSRVCCSCGFEGADKATCGRSDGVPTLIEVGPFAGQNVSGTCGGGCEGSAADVIGVMEYDTVSETFIENHNIKEGTGFGATPQASPDGKHIVMFPNDGGQNIRVLKAGSNGEPSTLAFDIPVDFSGVAPGKEATADFAFVQWKNHDVLALSFSGDSEVALVDLSESPPKVRKLQLSTATEGTGGSNVEWAYGTNYLWVAGNAADEAYVIRLSEDGNIDGASVERTLSGAPASKLIYVEDYAERKQQEMMANLVTGLVNQETTTTATISSGIDRDDIVAQVVDEMRLAEQADDDDDVDPIALAGLLIAIASILVNAVFVVYFLNIENTKQGVGSHLMNDVTRASDTEQADTVTLGSKRVA